MRFLAHFLSLLVVPYLAAADESMTLRKLEDLVKTKQPKNSSEFLAMLPDECRRYYNLVYASRSQQNSSYSSPRIISLCTISKVT